MPDQPSDAVTAAVPGSEHPRADASTRAERRARTASVPSAVVDDGAGAFGLGAGEPGDGSPSRHREPRTDWRLGGRTVRRWREVLLAVALLSLGVGLLAGTIVDAVWDAPAAAASATLLVWIGMLAPVVWGLARSRPVGLLRFRALDLLYGVALALILRIVQGWLEVRFGGDGAFPSIALVDGRIPGSWWLTDALPSVAIAAPLEDLFFRAVVLVSIYTILRRPFGKAAAAFAAVLGSTALFVVVHTLTGAGATDAVISLTLLGLVCGALVVLTGRIWGAILVHVVYNASFVALAALGTAWG